MADEDHQLQRGLADGDATAYRAAYDRYGPALHRAAARMLAGRADAEDAVQEVFTCLVRSRQHLINVEHLQAYIFTTLRRTVASMCRRQNRQAKAAGDCAALANETAGSEQSFNESDALQWAVAQLPDEQRDVIALKIDAELTFAQIASVLEISPNTAAGRYRYALERLRKLLEKHQ